MSSHPIRAGIGLLALCAALAWVPSQAADVTSTLTNSGLWTDDSIWDSALYPDNGNGGLTYDVVIAGSAVELDGGTFAIESLLTSGTITGPGTLTINGAAQWNEGTLAGTSQGPLVLAGVGPLQIQGSRTKFISGEVQNAGTWVMQESTVSTFDGMFSNAGVLDLQGDDVIFGAGASNTSVFNLTGGTIRRSVGTGTASLGWLSNSGQIDVQSGTLQVANGTLGGQAAIASGATLQLSGSTLEEGFVSTGEGLLATGNNTDLTIAGNAAVEHISIGNSTISGPSTLTINGASQWNEGTLAGTSQGPLVLAGVGPLQIQGSRTKFISGEVQNAGTWVMQESTVSTFDGTFSNAGVLDLQGDDVIFGAGASNTSVFNLTGGTIRRSVGTGTATINRLSNSGQIDVQSGTLLVANSSLGGQAAIASGATLLLTGGNTLEDGFVSTGEGLLATGNDLTNLSVAGNVEVDHISHGRSTISGPGTLTMNGASQWNEGTLAGTSQGPLVLAGPGPLQIQGSRTKFISGEVENAGVIDWTSGGGISFQGSPDAPVGLVNSGVFRVSRSGAAFSDSSGVAKLTNTATGELRLTGFSTIGVPVHSDGLINIPINETSWFSRGGEIGGVVDLALAGSELILNGAVILKDNLVSTGEGFIRFQGETLDVPDQTTLQHFDMIGGVLRGAGTLTLAGESFWTGGELRPTLDGSSLTLDGAGPFIITGSQTKQFPEGLINRGTLVWQQGIVQATSSQAELTNEGELILRGNGVSFDDNSTLSELGTIINTPSGVIRRTVGTGQVGVRADIVNEGLIEATSGTLTFQRQITGAGVFRATDGGVLEPNTQSILNEGTWEAVNGGTLNLPSLFLVGPDAIVRVSGASEILEGGADTIGFTNEGLFEVLGGATYRGSTTRTRPLINRGEVFVEAGSEIGDRRPVENDGLVRGAGTIQSLLLRGELRAEPSFNVGTLDVIGDSLITGEVIAANADITAGRLELPSGSTLRSPSLTIRGATAEVELSGLVDSSVGVSDGGAITGDSLIEGEITGFLSMNTGRFELPQSFNRLLVGGDFSAGGGLAGPARLLRGTLDVHGATTVSGGELVIEPGAHLETTGPVSVSPTGRLTVNDTVGFTVEVDRGTIASDGSGVVQGLTMVGGRLSTGPQATLGVAGDIITSGDVVVSPDSTIAVQQSVIVNDSLTLSEDALVASLGGIDVRPDAELELQLGNVTGSVSVDRGTLSGTGAISGNLEVVDGTVVSSGGLWVNRLDVRGDSTLEGGSIHVADGVTINSTLSVSQNASLTGTGGVNVGSAGTLLLDGSVQLDVDLDGSRLEGNGMIDGDVSIVGGVIAANSQAGTLQINGGLTSTGDTMLETGSISVDGPTPINSGTLAIAVDAVLTGIGTVNMTGGELEVRGRLDKDLAVAGTIAVLGDLGGQIVTIGDTRIFLPSGCEQTNPACFLIGSIMQVAHFLQIDVQTEFLLADVSSNSTLQIGAPGTYEQVTIGSDGMFEIATGGDVILGDVASPGTIQIVGSADGSGSANVSVSSADIPGTIQILDPNTTLSIGDLNLDGDVTAALPEGTLLDASNLSGSGSLQILAQTDAINAGSSPGRLTFGAASENALTIRLRNPNASNANPTFEFEVNDAVGAMGENPGWDAAIVSAGGVTFDASVGLDFAIDVVSLGLDNEPGVPANFDPTESYTWTFLDTETGFFGAAFEDINFLIDDEQFARENGLEQGGFAVVQDTLTSLALQYDFPGFRSYGDFNDDGAVDGTDFLLWQRGQSDKPLSENDLAEWQANFGDSNALAASQGESVPEPSTLILVMVVMLGLCGTTTRTT